MTQLSALHKLHANVAIWGPESVANAAADVVAATALVMGRLKLEQPPEVIQVDMSVLVEEPLNYFTRAARRALDDDGNPEPTVNPPGR